MQDDEINEECPSQHNLRIRIRSAIIRNKMKIKAISTLNKIERKPYNINIVNLKF